MTPVPKLLRKAPLNGSVLSRYHSPLPLQKRVTHSKFLSNQTRYPAGWRSPRKSVTSRLPLDVTVWTAVHSRQRCLLRYWVTLLRVDRPFQSNEFLSIFAAFSRVARS